jgi:plasmid stability protein
MTITVSFTPESEAKLRERAAASGKDVATFVREVVEEKLSSQASAPVSADGATPEQWSAQLHVWAAGHASLDRIADDDRQSIYAGRGQ